ncbi:hypothetical protein DOTSEDRAFT_33818 [Dothistroma septosporum NZE10]|uniref:Uncharacterized protein n=1 Tax=Dothistroma septosporum (strain NZE10 / CBS 128990) TaxID=675120 RepID=N1PPC9_DOTSN|nr:hypothetical protein DOTSEDRAFT_33818 [Dothistroma septosporum NZE10]
MQLTTLLFGLVATVLATSEAEPAMTPLAELVERQQEIGGGAAATLGSNDGTAGGAINGPTGAVQGCLGGAGSGAGGTTECYPVSTAPAPTDTQSHVAAGNAAGTLGPASASVDSDGFCGGGAVGNNGFTTCLVPTQSS